MQLIPLPFSSSLPPQPNPLAASAAKTKTNGDYYRHPLSPNLQPDRFFKKESECVGCPASVYNTYKRRGKKRTYIFLGGDMLWIIGEEILRVACRGQPRLAYCVLSV